MSRQNMYDDPEFVKGYREVRAKEKNYNNQYEQPAIRSLLPDPTGLRVLDLGCGSGGTCRYLVERGAASVLGTDISVEMLGDARSRTTNTPGITYQHIAMEDLDLPDGSIDLIVSSLAIQYVADYAGLVAKIARWLSSGGRLVFSIEHPVITGSDEVWVRDQNGNKTSWPLDKYSIEGPRERHWIVDGVIKYHRRMETTLNTLIENGLTIERILEPVPDAAAIERYPQLTDELVRPLFLFVRARKG